MSNIERPKEFQFDAKEDGRVDYDWKAYAEALEKENERLRKERELSHSTPTTLHNMVIEKDSQLQKLKEEIEDQRHWAINELNNRRDYSASKCFELIIDRLDKLLKPNNQ